jgi:hypothetical protein
VNNRSGFRGHGPRPDSAKEKFWRDVLKAFVGSGQSVRAFCSSRGVSEPSFYAWRRTLSRRDPKTNKAAGPAFVPVRLSPGGGLGATAAGRIEIALATGHRIRLRGPVDREALAEVVAVLIGSQASLPIQGEG